MTTKKIQAIDSNHIWHPFTQHKDFENLEPLVIERARGIFLYDKRGKRYYDTIASWWTNVHGHGHPTLTRAVSSQARRLDHVNFSGFTHRPACELVDALMQKLPPQLQKFFFSDNGSTAIEVALKMAFQFFTNQAIEGRHGFAYLTNAYHGDTLGAMSVGGIDQFHKVYDALRFSAQRMDFPTPPSQPDGSTGNVVNSPASAESIEKLRQFFFIHGSSLCAVIVEPLIQCVGGMQVYCAAWLQELAQLARSHQVFVIFDEVATGFGRTGSMFALNQCGVTPDFLCVSKGITGGLLPLALTITSKSVAQAFEGDAATKTFFHGHSYTANPISCAVALASLKLFDKEHTLEQMIEPAKIFAQLLTHSYEEDHIGDVRHLGLIGAVDIVKSKSRNQSFAPDVHIGQKIYRKSLKHGLVLRPLGDSIYWFLPLSVNKKQIKEIMKRSLDVIRHTVAEYA